MAYDKLVDSAVLDATFTGIADAIREKTGITEKFSQDDMADKIAAVYDAGKQAEYDSFWDAFQYNGTRTSYAECFRGNCWNDITFKPKYPIVLVGANSNAFRDSGITYSDPENPLQIDASQATTVSSLFYSADIENIGILDFRSAPALTSTFQEATKLKTIEKIILKDDGSQTASNAFYKCTALEEIRFGGVIGTSGWTFSNCSELSKDSIVSIINALSSTTSGITITISQTAVRKAFGSTSSEEWLNLRSTKQNWTINLGGS